MKKKILKKNIKRSKSESGENTDDLMKNSPIDNDEDLITKKKERKTKFSNDYVSDKQLFENKYYLNQLNQNNINNELNKISVPTTVNVNVCLNKSSFDDGNIKQGKNLKEDNTNDNNTYNKNNDLNENEKKKIFLVKRNSLNTIHKIKNEEDVNDKKKMKKKRKKES